MEAVEVGEKIKVGAVFDGSKVTPKWFMRGTRKYVLQSVEHRWRSKIGETAFTHFSATDGANVYELSFNLKTSEWSLDKIHLK